MRSRLVAGCVVVVNMEGEMSKHERRTRSGVKKEVKRDKGEEERQRRGLRPAIPTDGEHPATVRNDRPCLSSVAGSLVVETGVERG